jgi:ADP-heptose:LPS heptosyltransferase
MALLDSEPRSIALVRLRVGLGDLLCTIPALRALRARLPSAHVALVTWPETAPVVARLPGVDELLAFPGWPGIPEREPDAGAIPGWLDRVRGRFDVAVAMYGANPAANAVAEAMGPRATAGFFLPGRTRVDLATHVPYPVHLHEIDRHLHLLGHLGAPPAGRELAFEVTPQEVAAAAALAPPRPYALLHPGATSASRRWPADRWAAVGDELHAAGLHVGVTGVRGEEPQVRAVRAAMRAPSADLCGSTDLGAFAALVRGAELLAGNDSGPVHLAAAVGTRSVAAFLSGDPVRGP